MSTDRSRPGRGKSKRKGQRQQSQSGCIRLGPGVRLNRASRAEGGPVLLCASGPVPINDVAVAILRLCDGTRTREAIISELIHQSQPRTLAADIAAFLDVARARGWIVES